MVIYIYIYICYAALAPKDPFAQMERRILNFMGLYIRFIKRFFAAVDRSQNCAGVFTGISIHTYKYTYYIHTYIKKGLVQ